MAPQRVSIFRACIEVAFIIFLFYSNLLMGEFTKSSRAGKSWTYAFTDIFTEKNFGIALISAMVGFVIFETLRKRV